MDQIASSLDGIKYEDTENDTCFWLVHSSVHTGIAEKSSDLWNITVPIVASLSAEAIDGSKTKELVRRVPNHVTLPTAIWLLVSFALYTQQSTLSLIDSEGKSGAQSNATTTELHDRVILASMLINALHDISSYGIETSEEEKDNKKLTIKSRKMNAMKAQSWAQPPK